MQLAPQHLLRPGQGQSSPVHLLEDAVGAVQKLLALGGEDHLLVHAVKQAHLQLLLQQADLHRHRRLGVAQAAAALEKL